MRDADLDELYDLMTFGVAFRKVSYDPNTNKVISKRIPHSEVFSEEADKDGIVTGAIKHLKLKEEPTNF